MNDEFLNLLSENFDTLSSDQQNLILKIGKNITNKNLNPEVKKMIEDAGMNFQEVVKRIKRLKYDVYMKSKKPRIGRNEKCPCGSGKKYKKCCL